MVMVYFTLFLPRTELVRAEYHPIAQIQRVDVHLNLDQYKHCRPCTLHSTQMTRINHDLMGSPSPNHLPVQAPLV